MPLIGVTPARDKSTHKLTINQDYMDAVIRAGGTPVLLPLLSDQKRLTALLSQLDGLLLSGGEDVSPALYGEEKEAFCGDTDDLRDETEFILCREAVRRDLPVLAICRGVQVLNAALGGTLYQDIASQLPGALVHPRNDQPKAPVHGMQIHERTLLFSILGQEKIKVNSRHHQAVKAAAPGLCVNAEAPDGLIEGLEMPGKRFVLGVQWHPESLSEKHPEAQALFDALVRSCAQK